MAPDRCVTDTPASSAVVAHGTVSIGRPLATFSLMLPVKFFAPLPHCCFHFMIQQKGRTQNYRQTLFPCKNLAGSCRGSVFQRKFQSYRFVYTNSMGNKQGKEPSRDPEAPKSAPQKPSSAPAGRGATSGQKGNLHELL